MLAAAAHRARPGATTPAEEGLNIILVMLVVGLMFIAVIALGELTHWLRHRR